MTQTFNTLAADRRGRPDPTDPAACSRWLNERYMKSRRDADFCEALAEILETDADGALTAEPVRMGLGNETRGLAVCGASGSGKSMTIRRNIAKQAGIRLASDDEPGHALEHLVSPEATVKGVAIQLAAAVGYEIKPTVRTHEAWDIAMHRLIACGITLLWIDECHHLMRRAQGRDVQMVLQRLKSLMQGPNAITLVLSGVPELDDALLRDVETSRRFYRLNFGPLTGAADLNALGRYIRVCCDSVGVRHIDDDSFLERLIFANHGSLGSSIEATMKALGRALRRPERCLMLQDFRRGLQFETGTSGPGPYDDEPWPALRATLEQRGWTP